MALPATDVFTGTNGTQLTSYSANWTLNNGDFDIQSNSLACDVNDEAGAHWNADAFDNDQYAQCDVVGVFTSGLWVGVCVRAHASAATWYGFYGSGDDSYVYKIISGSWTQLGSAGSAFANGDEIRLEVQGTTITPTKNGSTTGTPGAQTDSAISSGSAGVGGYADANDSRIDNWEGGNLGGAAYTLTADQASFTLTGQATGLRVARKVTATQQAYTLSGQVAGLKAGRLVVATQASFTLTGQAAALLVDRLAVATQASFVLSGQAAALLSDRLLTANQQSYTLSGQEATLDYSGAGGYTISAEQANFTLTGQAAILQVQRTISSAQGSFTLAGQNVNLLADRLLTISQATYTMSGEDALLLAGRTISAGQASYLLTGQDVAFAVDYVVVAAYATYNLTGQDVLFDYSGIETPVERVYQIEAESRLYLISAENRVLTVEAETRVYAIS